jgi:hypothetical protein
MISKIIWQTHNYEYDSIPEHLKKCMLSWKMANPDWEHKYVDHNEREVFIKEKYPELYELYKRKRNIFQADIWRIAVVHEFGGVYVDMDSWCRKPLSYMLQNKEYNCLITEPYDNKPGEKLHVNNAMFAAPKNCVVLKNIIDEIVRKYKDFNLNLNKRHISEQVHINSIDIHSIFCDESIKNYNPFFDAGNHGKSYKNGMANIENEIIDYYGNTMTYRNYLKEILKLNDTDINNFI